MNAFAIKLTILKLQLKMLVNEFMNTFTIKLSIVLKLELKFSINELKSAFMIEFKSVLVHELKRLRNVLIKKLKLVHDCTYTCDRKGTEVCSLRILDIYSRFNFKR